MQDCYWWINAMKKEAFLFRALSFDYDVFIKHIFILN